MSLSCSSGSASRVQGVRHGDGSGRVLPLFASVYGRRCDSGEFCATSWGLVMLIPNGYRLMPVCRAGPSPQTRKGQSAPIVGMLALLLLIGSVTVAITSASSADSSICRMWRTLRRTPDYPHDPHPRRRMVWRRGVCEKAYLAEVQPGQDFHRVASGERVRGFWITACTCTCRLVFVRRCCRFWCLMALRVTARGLSRLKMSQALPPD